jgi:Glycosyltransferase family 87
MSTRGRLPQLADLVMAAAMTGVLYYLSLRVPLWDDFYAESALAVEALMAGHLHAFLTLVPVYGGSTLLQAPASMLGGALGGLDGAYRLGALFCVGTLVVLVLALARVQRLDGRSPLVRCLLIGVLLANPAGDWAVKEGHPEEIMAAVGCVGGMLLLVDGRVVAGAILLGLAAASKQWAILTLPLALAAAPRHRPRGCAAAAASALALTAPMLLVNAGKVVASNTGLSAAPSIFHIQQLWWTFHLYYMRPLGGPSSTIFGPAPIALVANYSHILIGVLAALLGGAFWWRRERVQPTDALLMLALVLLIRCMLDPWNVVYYQFPFIVALASWEVASHRRAPVFALATSVLVWSSFRSVPFTASADVANFFYITWALPAAMLMLCRSLRLPRPRALSPGGAQEMTVKPLERLVRTS